MQNIHRDGKWCEKNTAKKKKKICNLIEAMKYK